jgi:hypothetical protein
MIMGFWNLSGGETAATTGTDYEIPGGNLTPIPDGSDVLAMIDEAKWANVKDIGDPAEGPFTGPSYVSLRWTVVSPDEYKNRKIFHKLWVTDFDPQAKDEAKAITKRDKARRMLAAIDANAGGKLTAKDEQPTNDSLTLHLCNKPMIIKCMVWAIADRSGGADITGNWISAVAPAAKGVNLTAAAPVKAKPQARAMSQGSALDMDEIPFAPW